MRSKFIFTGFAPNLRKDDVRKACSFVFLPWMWPLWKRGASVKAVETWLADYFGVEDAISFDSGRSALYFCLKALGVKKDDEVILQAYTCVVVVNAILRLGAKPVYTDIASDYNMNPDLIEDKITHRSRVIIIQHTFGTAAKIDEIMAIAKKHNLKTIEDCAHSLGGKFGNRYLGTIADCGFFSFGSDKVVSSGRGGAAITNNRELGIKLRQYQTELKDSSTLKIKQHLLSFPLFWLGKKFYHFGVGKWLLYFAKTLHIINRIIYKREKLCDSVPFYPTKLPNALASILLGQLKTLDLNLAHRKKIASIYKNLITDYRLPITDSIFLRYPIQVETTPQLLKLAKEHNIILGDWYQSVIAPIDVSLDKTGYKKGTCPKAEKLASKSVNLPTNMNVIKLDAEKVCNLINSYLSSRNSFGYEA